MLRLLKNIWQTPDLRSRILFTLAIIALFRILAYIPMPGVNVVQLRNLFESNQLLNLLNLFSGGSLANFSIIALGLNPYINASIIMQLLTMVFPRLEELSKEGESGQKKINQYTRFLTLPLAIVQGIGVLILLRNQSIISTSDYLRMGLMVATMVAGSMLLIWLGELITEKGIGNGVSLLIFAGILAGFPTTLAQAFQTNTSQASTTFSLLTVIALLVIAGIVFITEGQRRIPVQYAKRLAGNRLVGGQSSHIPLRVNQAGVIPIIFAISLVLLPGTVASYLTRLPNQTVAGIARAVEAFFANTAYFGLIYFVMVVGFSFFYANVSFNPERISSELQKNGGFVPGIRPGKATADYLQNILVKITLIGGVFLGLVAVLPYLSRTFFPDVASLAIGGTSLLIVVSVILETSKQMEAMLVMRNYEGFLRK
jgi:preprotein translocase subunit SecY